MKFFILLCFFCFSIQAATPSYNNFNTNQFLRIGNDLFINGYGITNVNGTNITYQTKSAFSTNYTVLATDQILFCTGTNQVITLPTAVGKTGKIFTVVAATTTGSVIVTNSTGAQTILGGLSISVSATNRLTVVSNGSHYW